MSSDLVNLIQREIARSDLNTTKKMVGFLDSYNPLDHTGKVKYPTELDANGNPRITGWLPHQTAAGGAGASWVIGPTVGDQCTTEHLNGDPEAGVITGYLHNTTDTPPGAPSGTAILRHTPTGYKMTFDGGGLVIACGANTLTFNASGLVVVVGGNTLTFNPSVLSASQGTITNQGHDVGHAHVHTFGSGPLNSGPPP